MQSPLAPEGGAAAMPARADAAPSGSAGAAGSALTREPVRERRVRRVLAALCIAGIAVSMALIGSVALLGPSAAEPAIPSGYPWPLFFLHGQLHGQPGVRLVTWSAWLAVLAAGGGLAAGLSAVRRGWRPQPQLLIAGSLIAVLGLMLLPPIGSAGLLEDAVYGRIAALGHSPYQMTPKDFAATGDPMATFSTRILQRDPSPYGPLMTVIQEAASELGGDSVTRTMFWLKVWNALAFLAVALALDRMLRPDPARRTRAHLLWTANPLMLLAVMAGGHNDVLGVIFALLAVAALRRADFSSGLLAGVLAGTAMVLEAPFALVALGLAIAALRSPRALAGIAVGVTAVVLPTYAIAGKLAVASDLSEGGRGFSTYQPWQLVARFAPSFGTLSRTDTVAVAASVVLAAFLLWRMPPGLAQFPAVRPALALILAWLILSPQQRTWCDVMIFTLLALMPATKLDLIALVRAAVTAVAQLPGVTTPATNPLWLQRYAGALNTLLVPAAIALLTLTLIGLCLTRGTAGGRARGAPKHAFPG
jgi:hypothetical protein